MATIKVNGTIVPSNLGMIYDFLGMDYTSPKMVNDVLKDANGDDIDVVINSGGGDLYAGAEIYSTLKEYSGSVNVKVFALAASAASLIAMAGDKVSMSPVAQLMIHNVSTVASGDYNEMDKTSDDLQKANDALANAYVNKTGKSKDEILNLMNKETWLNADDAISDGFADEILFLDEKAPVISNSLVPLISNQTANQVMNIIQNKNKSKASKDYSDKLSEESIRSEINILKMKGKNYE